MSYRCFTKLKESLSGDIAAKLNKDVPSFGFDNLDCNCQRRRTRGCDYNNMCRNRCIVYKCTCNNTGKFYIGATHQNFKLRMGAHFQEAKRFAERGEYYDTYAEHWGGYYRQMVVSPELQRNNSTYEVLWQGKPLSCVKTFGTPQCQLCNHERLEIFKHRRKHPERILNKLNELTGKCRHHPKFHRYKDQHDDQH